MEFLFSCSTRHLTRSLRSLESYRVKHSKRNSISTRAYVLFSPHIYINFLFLSISFLFFFRLSGLLHSCGVLIHRYSSSGTNIVTNEWKLGNKHNIAMASFSYKICHYLLPGRGEGGSSENFGKDYIVFRGNEWGFSQSLLTQCRGWILKIFQELR